MTTVLATVGTDRHRFDRLVDWLERWHATRPHPPRLVVQHGFSRAPALPGAVAFLGHAELRAVMAAATLVVSHGGPATITEARRAGHLPIVVPRDPRLAEHVDDHQLRFTRRLSRERMVRRCESEVELRAALHTGLADPARFRWRADPDESRLRAEAVAAVGRIVEDLMARPPRRPGPTGDGPRR